MKILGTVLLAIVLGVSMSAVQAGGGHGKGHGHHGKPHAAQHHRGHGGHHHRHHRHHGDHDRTYTSFVFSYGYRGYPYSYYPYGYPERIVIREPSAPVVYVEKEDRQEPHYWYYCKDPQGYYPHVDRCPTGWMKVVPDSPEP